jgi:hypothetical protein
MSAIRIVLVLGVAAAVLIRPALLPFAAIGVVVGAAVWLWDRRRTGAGTFEPEPPPIKAVGPEWRAAVIAAGGVLLATLATLTALLSGGADDGAPPGGGLRPAPVVTLHATYTAHLQLTGARDLRITEILVPTTPRSDARLSRRSLTRALGSDGWLPVAGDGYQRSRSRDLDVPGFLPAQRGNSFSPPSGELELPDGRALNVVLNSASSRVVFDAPRNAIGDTFPAGQRGVGPRGGDRITLQLPEFADALEFDVRSRPFRNPILVKTVDVTVWTPFGWMLALVVPLISDRVREVIVDWMKRLFQRRKPPPRRRRRAHA